MKPYGNQSKQNLTLLCEQFTSSISFDRRLCLYDIAGSIAHVKMLGEQKIITDEEEEKIVSGLQQIFSEYKNCPSKFSEDSEDIHMAIEHALIQKIGDTGGKIHTARSRNDQVALDMKLYVRCEIANILKSIIELQDKLLSLSKKYETVIMPGYTHLQPAQPVLLGHHLMAYFYKFQRDFERLEDTYGRVNQNPLGSGALSGTSFDIDRGYTTQLLGFEKPTENSMDSVSDRDFVCETIFDLGMVMMHLSGLCEELILWSTKEFRFISISDAYTTGSSMMPQKKNPDVLELVRGKTGRVYGDLTSILALLKSLPMTYNRDLQEDKFPLFDAIDTTKSCLSAIAEVLSGIGINEREIMKNLHATLVNATDMADYLAKKGMPFRKAHNVTGKIVLHCIYNKRTLNDLSLKELKGFSGLFEKDIFKDIALKNCINSKNSFGGTSTTQMKLSIDRGKEILKNNFTSAKKISDISIQPLQKLLKSKTHYQNGLK